MGMTDSQFKAFIMFLIDALKNAIDATDPEEKTKRLNKILENLQSSLED